MLLRSDRPIELAMSHRIGAEGITERCLRPKQIRDAVERVQRWAVQLEVCQSCSSLPAVAIRGGMALCGKCRAQYIDRFAGNPEGRAPVDVRVDGDPSGPELQGYAIVFNSRSVDMGFIEIIRPAAADRLIAEAPDVRYLWNHNSDMTLGRASAGTLRYEKRTRGVWIAVDPPNWASAQIESVDRRDITGQSFGFYVLEDDWHLEEGYPVREIFDMAVLEFSGVSFPAYPDTTLKVVNADARRMERQTAERLRLAR